MYRKSAIKHKEQHRSYLQQYYLDLYVLSFFLLIFAALENYRTINAQNNCRLIKRSFKHSLHLAYYLDFYKPNKYKPSKQQISCFEL